MKKLLFIGLMVLLSRLVFAGGYNTYQFIIGERASGMGGAFTALASDSSAIWYNPGGLAQIKTSHLNLSADAYSYAANDLEGFNQFQHYDGSVSSIDLSKKDLSIAPTTLVYGLGREGKGSLAFGLVVPISTDLEGEIAGDFQDVSNSVKYVSHSADSTKLQIGMLGWGKSLTERLNVGAAIGLSYGSLVVNRADSVYVVKSGSLEITRNGNIYSKLQTFSGQLHLGVQYTGTRHHWGLNVQTPTYRIYNIMSVDTTLTTSSVATNTGDNDFTNTSWKDDLFSFAPLFPGRVVLGYAYILSNRFILSVDAELVLPLKLNKVVGLTVFKKPVFNLRVGTEVYLRSGMILRAGLYTDRSPTINVLSASDNEQKIDYYGASLSLAYRQGLSYLNKETALPGEMWTSFGLNYRLGAGEFKSTVFDVDLKPSYEVKQTLSHDIGVFIAKSIAY